MYTLLTFVPGHQVSNNDGADNGRRQRPPTTQNFWRSQAHLGRLETLAAGVIKHGGLTDINGDMDWVNRETAHQHPVICFIPDSLTRFSPNFDLNSHFFKDFLKDSGSQNLRLHLNLIFFVSAHLQ